MLVYLSFGLFFSFFISFIEVVWYLMFKILRFFVILGDLRLLWL